MKKRILALMAAGTMLLTGCGAQNAAQSDAANSGSDDLQHLTVVLDWYPNALPVRSAGEGLLRRGRSGCGYPVSGRRKRCNEHGCCR